ncbi:MAG: SDR family oxidoreductase [Myxococcota bacterium]
MHHRRLRHGQGRRREPRQEPRRRVRSARHPRERDLARTDGLEGFLSWLATVEGLRERFESEVPLRRLGTPEDIARTAVFLASDEASFVSGVVVPVDGGIASQYPTPQAELPED